MLSKYSNYVLPLIDLLFPLAIAFFSEVFFAHGPNIFMRLVSFRYSVLKDIFYWVFYISAAASAIMIFTPLGQVEQLLSLHMKPLIPVGEWMGEKWHAPFVGGLIGLIAMDLAHYIAHWTMHKFEPLWKFHAVHHSAEEMVLFTGARITLTEKAYFNIIAILIMAPLGLNIGTMFGVLLIRRLIDILQHSNLGWTYGFLGYVFASPLNHRLHHSMRPEDWNSNYGNILSIWDHLFGTANARMSRVNKTLNSEDQFDIGLPKEVEPFGSGLLSHPIIQEMAIWISFFLPSRKRASPGAQLDIAN